VGTDIIKTDMPGEKKMAKALLVIDKLAVYFVEGK
jgi:hypothetical protein